MITQRIQAALLAAAVLAFAMPRVANAAELIENWDSLSSWRTSGDARIEPAGQLLLRGSPSITSAYRTAPGISDSYKLNVVAKVDFYTAGAENLGFKVSDGMRRLMFQRRSDGFYAITSATAGAWVQVHPTSEYTGWGEYEFTVTRGDVSLRTRRWPNGTWDRPTTWTLPAHGAEQRVEVWLKGASGDAHVDRLTLSDPTPAASAAARVCLPVEAGPIWNKQDGEVKCPQTCSPYGTWSGEWWTPVWGKMSVCECCLSRPATVPVEAGPIWSTEDAQTRCPQTCGRYGSWTGQWRTTVLGAMSVCDCRIQL